MLFQGQEFAASSPFVFFADHHEELAQLVKKGRAGFLSQFPTLTTPEMQAQLADPHAPETFEQCKLDLSERQTHAAAYALHKDLLALRRTDPVFAARTSIDGAVFSEQACVLRFTGATAEQRLLLVNLGRDLRLQHAPEPLLAPPSGRVVERRSALRRARHTACRNGGSMERTRRIRRSADAESGTGGVA